MVLTPEKAGEALFLETLTSLKPDLCITAAYGNFLPSKFLAIPKFGTLNIHPSLLPKYRGAAPVPRCLENGDNKTGVCVLFTGPIISLAAVY
jgi:methionyl-tRNA formyltransferase